MDPAAGRMYRPTVTDPRPSCPCGSGEPEERCCAPFLAGAPAPTALALMRSRYTAYVRCAVDYLVETHDPATRDDLDRAGIEKWSRETEWQGLEILDSEAGAAGDDEGMVEFKARGATDGKPFVHHERSRFRRADGRWVFVAGQSPPPARRKPQAGRNDPCPCGSGKKFKRCHGG